LKARRNAELYELEDKTEFIVGDVLDIQLLESIKVGVAILDPDWSVEGEGDSNHVARLSQTEPSFPDILQLTRKHITKNVVARLPKTVLNEEIRRYGPCEIEVISWDGKPRFKIVYWLPGVDGDTRLDFTNILKK
jgi:hypothetical protein